MVMKKAHRAQQVQVQVLGVVLKVHLTVVTKAAVVQLMVAQAATVLYYTILVGLRLRPPDGIRDGPERRNEWLEQLCVAARGPSSRTGLGWG